MSDAQSLPLYENVRLTEYDIYLFCAGENYRAYKKWGAHICQKEDVSGVYFSLWAPNAQEVQVVGDFNNWQRDKNIMTPVGEAGVWELFIPDLNCGERYKYFIKSRYSNFHVYKADPFAYYAECPPQTASKVWSLTASAENNFSWKDSEWILSQRKKVNALQAPWSIYEVQLGSWKKLQGEESSFYQGMAKILPTYVRKMGFTHVEFLPLMEHPFYGSWGYQVSSYFAPTARYGTPQDLMFLIEAFHLQGIGVILDWVPAHFPTDQHALAFFDGSYLFEHADPQQGFHPDWKSAIFNYGRSEVQSFLLSSALFWIENYHFDGLRVDGVASMLYLDYSRRQGEWIPNRYGGRENLEAIDFLQKLNTLLSSEHPDVISIAEESTAWPHVTAPHYVGGLGFSMKWDMGWMHDTLMYFQLDPIHRQYHHHLLTFRNLYAFTENFVLTLSHDEVVHGKGSLLQKMPGDQWQKFAHLRLLFTLMMATAGKKLLFMGAELGGMGEWDHQGELPWELLSQEFPAGLHLSLRDLLQLYRQEKALYLEDFSANGTLFHQHHDSTQSVFSFYRLGGEEILLFIGNFTPVPRRHYQLGVCQGGFWQEIYNSDALDYGGSGVGNLGGTWAQAIPAHGESYSLELVLPPLGALILKRRTEL